MIRLDIFNHNVYKYLFPLRNLSVLTFGIGIVNFFLSPKFYAFGISCVLYSVIIFILFSLLLLLKIRQGYIELSESGITWIDSNDNYIEFTDGYKAIITLNIEKQEWDKEQLDLKKIYTWDNKIHIIDKHNNDFIFKIHLSNSIKNELFYINNLNITLEPILNRQVLYFSPFEILRSVIDTILIIYPRL